MRIEVSARLISVPQRCVCCLGAADRQKTVTASRITGVRVVRTESKEWTFPICSACCSYVDDWHSGDEDFALAKCQASLPALIGFCLLGASARLTSWASFSLAALGGFAFLASVAWCVVGDRERTATRNLILRKSGLTYAELFTPVVYLGWSGTVHAFEFANQGYAAQFMAANAEKLVNLGADGQTWFHERRMRGSGRSGAREIGNAKKWL